MRQVPSNYAILGDGNMAKHFCHYLSLLKIPYTQWSRRQDPDFLQLNDIIHNSERIVILLKDSSIEPFIQHYLQNTKKPLIHFSGNLSSQYAIGAHPLMTFSNELYSLDTYKKITFILENNSPDLAELLPGLDNSFYRIDPAQKSFYHALCVMSGNFTTILWQKFFKELSTNFRIPENIAHLYLEQIVTNLKNNPAGALTGPLARKDFSTINQHLKALEHDPFNKIYEAFVNVTLPQEKL